MTNACIWMLSIEKICWEESLLDVLLDYFITNSENICHLSHSKKLYLKKKNTGFKSLVKGLKSLAVKSRQLTNHCF